MKKLILCSLICFTTQLMAGTPGTVKWSNPLSAPAVAAPTLSEDGNTLYVGSIDGQLTAMSAVNGAILWKYQFDGGIYSPVAYDDAAQVVYVTTNANDVSQTGGIYALNGKTGALINAIPSPGNDCQFGQPMLANYSLAGSTDKPVAYAYYCAANGLEYTTIGEFIYSLDQSKFNPTLTYEQIPYDASQLDSYRKKSIVFDQNPHPLLADLEGVIIPSYGVIPVTTQPIGPALADWNMMASEPSDFSARFWQGNIIPDVKFSTPAYDNDRRLIYVGGSDGNLYAYDPHSQAFNAKHIFALQLGGDLSQNPPLAVTDGTIYVTSTNGFLYTLTVRQSPTNNKLQVAVLKWKILLSPGTGFASRPAIDNYSHGGYQAVYVTDQKGIVYAVMDFGTFGYQASFSPLPMTGISSTPTIGRDGTVYLTNNSSTDEICAIYGFLG